MEQKDEMIQKRQKRNIQTLEQKIVEGANQYAQEYYEKNQMPSTEEFNQKLGKINQTILKHSWYKNKPVNAAQNPKIHLNHFRDEENKYLLQSMPKSSVQIVAIWNQHERDQGQLDTIIQDQEEVDEDKELEQVIQQDIENEKKKIEEQEQRKKYIYDLIIEIKEILIQKKEQIIKRNKFSQVFDMKSICRDSSQKSLCTTYQKSNQPHLNFPQISKTNQQSRKTSILKQAGMRIISQQIQKQKQQSFLDAQLGNFKTVRSFTQISQQEKTNQKSQILNQNKNSISKGEFIEKQDGQYLNIDSIIKQRQNSDNKSFLIAKRQENNNLITSRNKSNSENKILITEVDPNQDNISNSDLKKSQYKQVQQSSLRNTNYNDFPDINIQSLYRNYNYANQVIDENNQLSDITPISDQNSNFYASEQNQDKDIHDPEIDQYALEIINTSLKKLDKLQKKYAKSENTATLIQKQLKNIEQYEQSMRQLYEKIIKEENERGKVKEKEKKREKLRDKPQQISSLEKNSPQSNYINSRNLTKIDFYNQNNQNEQQYQKHANDTPKCQKNQQQQNDIQQYLQSMKDLSRKKYDDRNKELQAVNNKEPNLQDMLKKYSFLKDNKSNISMPKIVNSSKKQGYNNSQKKQSDFDQNNKSRSQPKTSGNHQISRQKSLNESLNKTKVQITEKNDKTLANNQTSLSQQVLSKLSQTQQSYAFNQDLFLPERLQKYLSLELFLQDEKKKMKKKKNPNDVQNPPTERQKEHLREKRSKSEYFNKIGSNLNEIMYICEQVTNQSKHEIQNINEMKQLVEKRTDKSLKFFKTDQDQDDEKAKQQIQQNEKIHEFLKSQIMNGYFKNYLNKPKAQENLKKNDLLGTKEFAQYNGISNYIQNPVIYHKMLYGTQRESIKKQQKDNRGYLIKQEKQLRKFVNFQDFADFK
ncbi:hypothetical protein PPERSA_02822 [Pseudocohnilembus persalinus]|uniref:Uncharacterized protein n=1 Tax=Pseudocohnilembus persalinus TaxID=266149 RepID=A0A0V0QM79_PSEPJ|nr:hypothetical protein PPERSA_02822 [Pseudocohnilembus persalinus]|eukprot:KRX03443.1 hypothetical protein PPERSA_02822 [Pseudocohnilembus persalinus]